MVIGLVNKVLKPIGLQVVRGEQARRTDPLYYQHDYGRDGYDAYAKSQVDANKAKLNNVWAEGRTLEIIAQHIERHPPAIPSGVCHGARNGWEVHWLRNRLNCPVVGTDISETATLIPGMIQHDFHEVREDWLGKFSFIYTNSLDQAFAPDRALATWSDQLTDDGLIFVEHTMHHAPQGASEMDPFGAHPMIMPYLFFKWGRGRYDLADIIELSNVKMGDGGVFEDKGDVWVFVLRKAMQHPPAAAS